MTENKLVDVKERRIKIKRCNLPLTNAVTVKNMGMPIKVTDGIAAENSSAIKSANRTAPLTTAITS